jgi:hypothetical protein
MALDAQLQFEPLVAQFQGFMRDLGKCQSPQLRWILFQRMALALEELDRLILNEQLALAQSPTQALSQQSKIRTDFAWCDLFQHFKRASEAEQPLEIQLLLGFG